jgi:hypothetical protein
MDGRIVHLTKIHEILLKHPQETYKLQVNVKLNTITVKGKDPKTRNAYIESNDALNNVLYNDTIKVGQFAACLLISELDEFKQLLESYTNNYLYDIQLDLESVTVTIFYDNCEMELDIAADRLCYSFDKENEEDVLVDNDCIAELKSYCMHNKFEDLTYEKISAMKKSMIYQ